MADSIKEIIGIYAKGGASIVNIIFRNTNSLANPVVVSRMSVVH